MRSTCLLTATLAAALSAVGAFASSAASSVFPCRQEAVLDAIELTGPWRFRFDSSDVGVTGAWFNASTGETGWTSIDIPRVWDVPDGAVIGHVKEAVGWYRLDAVIPSSWTHDVRLAFLGASYTADVWIDGVYAGVHRGGFTPFAVGVRPRAGPGGTVRIAVRVSNAVDAGTVPSRDCGWRHYGGLCREVYLLHQPKVRPAWIDVSAELGPGGACTASVRAGFNRPPGRGRVRVRLEAGGKTVAKGEVGVSTNAEPTLAIAMPVKLPRLWSPDDPFLHRLTLEWDGGRHSLPVGLRSLRVDGESLLLNGQPLWLQGFGQHEVSPDNGPILSPELRRRDLEQMKTVFHANAVRAGHYPNHPDLYNLADELGLVVFTEIPAWHISRPVLESEDCWEQWLEPQLSEMVTSLRHHASVVFWGIANEVGGTHAYYRRAVDLIHAADPVRPVAAVHASTADLASVAIFDMEARNFHFGWYHSQDVYEGPALARQVFQAARGKPVWVAETGGLARRGNLGGGYGDASRGTETYLDRILRFNVSFCSTVTNQIPGVSVWTWTDFPRGNGIEPHGILTTLREPKLAAYTLCNLLRGDMRLVALEVNTHVLPGEPWKADLRTFNPLRRARKGLTARWRILKGDDTVAQDSFPFDACAERSEFLRAIEWRSPDDALPGLYVAWLELFDGDTRLHVSSVAFDLHQASRPGLLRVSAPPPSEEDAWMDFAGIRLPVYPLVGLQMPLEAGEYDVALGLGSRALRRERVMIERATVNDLAFPMP